MQQSREQKRKSDERRASLPLVRYPPALPIVAKRDEIAAAIRRHPVVIVTGETGSGKSTQIPKICLEAGRGLLGLIGCTQPRRIAATTIAGRIAEEMGEPIGRSVGYKIRFSDRTPKRAFLKVMTDGILLMEAQGDPLLRAYDTLIVDEAHERSLNIDFLLGILRNLLPRRPELRVIVTSATIDAEKFSRAFDDAPVIEVSGRLYPVAVRYEPPARLPDDGGEVGHIDAAVRAVEGLCDRRERGDILLFMPTEQDIRETRELLSARLREKAEILPLFSRLARQEQERIFEPTPLRKIVVATNVAETSLTIPGIRYVIDTGLARIAQYNPRTGTAALPVRAISRSSADQRKGRCGRVENGVCIRLYAEEDYLARPLYTPPEILRSNLAGVILRMLSLGLGEIDAFPFIDRPAPKSIRDGFEILLELGAIERGNSPAGPGAAPWRLTERGRLMARLPIDPRLARIVLEASREGCLEEILVIAAALSCQDPRERPAEREAEADRLHASFRDPASDFVTLLRIWQRCHDAGGGAPSENRIRRFCREQMLSYRRMREWRDVHGQLRTILAEQRFGSDPPAVPKKEGPELYSAIHRSILAGYLGQIALRKEKNLFLATRGREAMIFPGSGLFGRAGQWIVAAELVETSRLYARVAANIDSRWLEELGGDLCRRSYHAPRWEKSRGEVVASEQVTLFGLTIVSGRPVSFGRIDPAEASRIFVRSALVEGEVRQPPPFLLHNRRLVEKIAAIEEKLRRRDLLVDEEGIARFYEERLPGIFDIRTLQRLIRDRGGDGFLRMEETDLLMKPPDAAEIALFPETVSAGGWRLDCVYRFAPGQAADGVTLKVPAAAAPAIGQAPLDWLVPGLLPEKVEALLRGLPKEYRKRLMPLARTREIVLAEMPREGALVHALGRFLYERFAVDIPADRWPEQALDDHLKLRFSVVDRDERELVAGREAALLKRGFGDRGDPQALAAARRRFERGPLVAWDFGDLPESVPLDDGRGAGSLAYPALAADGEQVHLRLFPDPAAAKRAHPGGVQGLYLHRFAVELRHLRKGVAPAGELKLWSAAFGGARALEKAILEKVAHELLAVEVRTAEAFAAHGDAIRPRLLPLGQELLQTVRPLLKALYEVTERFRQLEQANRDNRPFLAYLARLRDELSLLFPADFLIRHDTERLAHIGRYLRALALRAERGAVHLEKALSRMAEIGELEKRRAEIEERMPPFASAEKRRALEELRWIIEEYKVSLFAQELKTPYPVSRKRIDARIAEIERLL